MEHLKSEVIRIKNNTCDLQVFEDTRGIKIGDNVEFTSELLSIELGPGILNNVYDGLGNPLEKLAEKTGYFLQRGVYLNSISYEKKWTFKQIAKKGNLLLRGEVIGSVNEGNINHYIMVPFAILDNT
jgi:V/A-type H+-transporting ATPase subunit A